MGKYVIKEGKSGWSFNLVAGNGQTIGVSEVYSSRAACESGAGSVKRAAGAAGVEDQTVEGFATEKHPKFEVYKDKKGEFRFRLKSVNGEIVLTGEGYEGKAGCLNGVDSVKRNADSPVE